MTTRLALVASALALIAGLATIAYLVSDAEPLTLCNLWPLRCFSPNVSGMRVFSGDSQAAPVLNVTLAFVAPLLSVCAAILHLRRLFAPALMLAALACVPYTVFLFGAIAVMPFHPLVAAAVLVTFLAVSFGTTRAVWAPQPT